MNKQTILQSLKQQGIWVLGGLIGGILIGMLIWASGPAENHDHEAHGAPGSTEWTCSMHPQIRLEEPGQCPICFMDLIPLEQGSMVTSKTQLRLTEAAAALAQIETVPVRREIATHEVKLSGRIAVDESRVKNVSAWFSGRLERLFVDYTGIRVSQGDHLYKIYSPELFALQEELLHAHGRMELSQENAEIAERARNTYSIVVEKAKLLGLNEGQIQNIIDRGEPRNELQVNSPISGVVTRKLVQEGKYVRTGESIYTVADLSHVWLMLDAYEMDLPWLAYGQKIEFQIPSMPGEIFEAQISYIDPLVNPLTHVVQVRAVLDNSHGRFKPGMLVRATIQAGMDANGHVLQHDMSGKWICPMHPEVVASVAGSCSVCGMDLVPLQKQPAQQNELAALLVPSSAILRTGEKTLVYVQKSTHLDHLYELREIILGPAAGSDHVVLSGLDEGEKVVRQGNFKIDSAMQIAGRPSLMSAEEHATAEDLSATLRAYLADLFEIYIGLQEALAADDRATAEDHYRTLHAAEQNLESSSKLPSKWQSIRPSVPFSEGLSIENLRTHFEPISEYVLTLSRIYGLSGTEILYEAHCPMAFDNSGANWLQRGREINNPYFGDLMLRCGEVTETFVPENIQYE